jgi:hypothetical protein
MIVRHSEKTSAQHSDARYHCLKREPKLLPEYNRRGPVIQARADFFP